MIDGIPKISVLVITYNQEDVISRAIDSLLAQKDYIYEICVSDDCSKDRTWEILQEYSLKYPGLFVLNRNNLNIGIFENIEKTWEMPTGDIIYRLAGDDECGSGWFKIVCDFIAKKNIDYKNDLFCIYGDYKCVYPNGDSFLYQNILIDKDDDVLSLAIRGKVCNRSSCSSSNILKKYVKVSKGRSHVAENAIDRQLQVFTDTNYYIKYVGNIYHANVGVSTRITDEQRKERLNIIPYTIAVFDKLGVSLKRKDKTFLQMEAFAARNRYDKKTFKNYFNYCILKLTSLRTSHIISIQTIRHFAFAFLRRLPHNKPIHFE